MESNETAALRLLQQAKLSHPDLPLLERFIHDAVDSDRAAKYLIAFCENDINGNKLSQFQDDWKALVKAFYIEDPYQLCPTVSVERTVSQRDGNRCCMTGARSRFWNTCRAVPIVSPAALSSIQKGPLYDLLGEFISPSKRDQILDYDASNEATSRYWFLSKDGATAFFRGDFRLEKLEDANKYDITYNKIGGKYPAIYKYERFYKWHCLLDDHTKSGIPIADPFLIDIHARFSRAFKWHTIATEMQEKVKCRRTQFRFAMPFSSFITNTCHTIWLKLPTSVRLQSYRLLKTVGVRLYGTSISRAVQRLPFGLYLKFGRAHNYDIFLREYTALQLVRSQTSVPVPCPLDLVCSASTSFLLTSRIEGEPAGINLHYYTDSEMQNMVHDLRNWLTELRSIEPPKSDNAIMGVTGGSCYDFRIDGIEAGPFKDEREFSESLRLGILPDLVHRHDHEIVFTHGDLNLRNVLVKDGKVCGIVDWENAGWYPEYWEYTKIHFGVRLSTRWLIMVVDKIFGDKYRDELEIEKQYWEYHSLF